MLSEILVLLQEDGKREIYKGTKKHISVAVFPNSPKQ